jgi:hypothetical protein
MMIDQIEQGATAIKAAKRSVLQPNPRYRSAIGWLGFVLPIVVAAWPWPFSSLQNSISAYYYTGARNWFVGTLWVLALFLFFYQYEPRGTRSPRSKVRIIVTGAADTILGIVAGVSAFAVAMLPTTAPPCPEGQTECQALQPAIIGGAHGFFAGLLFVALALFPLLLFSQTADPSRARMYRFCGGLMLFLILAVAIYAWCFPLSWRLALAPFRPVYVVEAVLIFVFGYTWLKKGQELAEERA